MAGLTREERSRRAALAAEIAAGNPDNQTAAPETVTGEPTEQHPPTFSVAERRLKHGDVAMLRAQADFTLVGVDQEMAIYWGMTENAYDLINIYGWVPVHKRHLPMAPSMLGLSEGPDGNVTRGKSGSEMLFMMPKVTRESILFDQEQRRQVMRRSRRMWQKANQMSAETDAANEALSPAQRASALRAANAMQDSRKAQWVPLGSVESHGREPID